MEDIHNMDELKQQINAIKRKNKKIHTVLTKHRKLFTSYIDRVDFKEPLLFLARRNGKTEIYEGVTTGKHEFEHTDGSQRYILVSRANIQRMDYGKGEFSYFWCHEDFPLPFPNTGAYSTDEVVIALEKATHELEQLKAKPLNKYADTIWKTALGIAVIIAAYTFYKMLAGDVTPPEPTQAAQIAHNLTKL